MTEMKKTPFASCRIKKKMAHKENVVERQGNIEKREGVGVQIKKRWKKPLGSGFGEEKKEKQIQKMH